MSILRIFDLPALCIRHRELLWSFVWRDLKARYEGSILGRLWPLLNPIILFLVYYFVFAVIMGMKLADRGQEFGDQSLMGLFIISGVLPWIAFGESVSRCTSVVLENGNLVKKIAFPSQLLPVYATAVNFIYFFIALAVFLVLRLTAFHDLGVGPDGQPLVGLPDSWPILFVAIALHFAFSVGLGLLLGALNIFVRDTAQVVPLALNLWFFTTPIVYPTELIRQRLPEYLWVMQLNPMYHLMEMYRAALVYDHGATPWRSAGIFALCVLVVYVPGYAFFRSTKGRFADEL